ncbi:hypothetical protein [uncultured Aquimarina sp.]|uniref:hypothetical protein n=1 Tax=uncultured Aquimarina sp. TaxID=575652 RepID=UPI002632AAB4|nr:hypothetical protein [uncultured Aquimarina sp.]
MKNLLLSLIFISFSIAMNAQETDITSNNNQTKENVAITKSAISLSNTKSNTVHIDKVCYSETSKVAFYEVLIAKNGFKINLKNSTDLVIKNTEEIISKKRDEILYSEED